MPVEEEKIKILNSFLDECNQGPFGSKVRFKLVSSSKKDLDNLKGLTTYGFIRGANSFLLGAVQRAPKDLEDFGYQFEQVLLFATRMGLASCWLGGTLNRTNFASRMDLSKHEIMPAASPIGYPTGSRGKFDSVVRWVVGSKKRKRWEELFFEGDFSKTWDVDYQKNPFCAALEMVRLAPSSSNKQPWRIVKDCEKNIFHLFLQRSKNYHRKDSNTIDLQRIDMGIAMCHFDLSVSALDLKGQWVVKDPEIAYRPKECDYLVSWQAAD